MRLSKLVPWVLLLLLAILSATHAALAKDPAENPNRPFKDFEGCFLLYDLKKQAYMIKNNELLAASRQSPCSTFKVPHAIIGLELGILKDGNTVFEWDGKPMNFPEWEKDQTLNTAMANSVVWYFQKLAQKVGQAQMSAYLAKFSYGNQDISGGLQRFWLMSSLKISPHEQIYFLRKLAMNDLPVSQRAMDITKLAILQGRQGNATLFGKTGSGATKGRYSQGWFVGWYESPTKNLLFATFIKAPNGANGGKAKVLTLARLRELGLWQ